MSHKNDYAVIAFFDNQKPKKWSYVHKLSTFRRFLDEKHSAWTYINVYDRRSKSHLKRFYKDEVLPDFI
jgi:hypothetical protein